MRRRFPGEVVWMLDTGKHVGGGAGCFGITINRMQQQCEAIAGALCQAAWEVSPR